MIKSTGRFFVIFLAASLTAFAIYKVVQNNSGIPAEDELRELIGGETENLVPQGQTRGGVPPRVSLPSS